MKTPISAEPNSASKDIAMLFSKPESIDCVISALLAVKKATFGENNLAHIYLDEKSATD